MYENWTLNPLTIHCQCSNQLSQTGLVCHVWLVTYITSSSCHNHFQCHDSQPQQQQPTTTTTTPTITSRWTQLDNTTTMGHVHQRGRLASGTFFVLSFFLYSTNFYLQTTSKLQPPQRGNEWPPPVWWQTHEDEDDGQLEYQARALGLETHQSYVFFYLHLLTILQVLFTTSLRVLSQLDDMMTMRQGHERGLRC